MLMSEAFRSDSATGWPSRGPSALAAPQPSARTSTKAHLCVDMPDLATSVDCPARDGVEVLARKSGDRRRRRRFAALGDELRAGRLRVAGFIPGAALQHCRATIPAPGNAKARERFAQYGLLQRRLRPALAAVGRYHHFGDPAVARIGDAGNLVKAGPLEFESRRGMGDKRFHFLQEIELVCLAVGQNLRIGSRLVVTHRRL